MNEQYVTYTFHNIKIMIFPPYIPLNPLANNFVKSRHIGYLMDSFVLK